MFGAQQAMNIFIIFKSTLDACMDVNQVDNFKTMVFTWYTGILFGLTPFKTGFVAYVECDILVKYVTKVIKVLGIKITTHKFYYTKGDYV